jgi:hypothetical protein
MGTGAGPPSLGNVLSVVLLTLLGFLMTLLVVTLFVGGFLWLKDKQGAGGDGENNGTS